MANYVRVPEDEAHWECPGCQELHEERDNALICCASAGEAYRCDVCDSSYGEEYEAKDCCPRVTAGYDCTECGAFYQTEEEAINCHSSTEAKLAIYRCVVDGLVYPTEEEANGCCAHRNPNGVLVEYEEDHGDCNCQRCAPTTKVVPESLETISLPQEDEWESQLA